MDKINYEKPVWDIKLIHLEVSFMTGSEFTSETDGNAGDIESGGNIGDSDDFHIY